MRRLAHYCIGLAIGLVLLGFFQQRRAAEWSARQQTNEAARRPMSAADTTNETPRPRDEGTKQPDADPDAVPSASAATEHADVEGHPIHRKIDGSTHGHPDGPTDTGG